MMRSVVISMRLPPNAAYCAAWNSSFLTTFGRLSGSRSPTSRDGAGHDARAKIVPVVIPVFDPAIVAPGGPIGIMACSYGIFAHMAGWSGIQPCRALMDMDNGAAQN